VDENVNVAHSKDEALWNGFVKDLNNALNPLDLEFKIIVEEINDEQGPGRKMCALVCSTVQLPDRKIDHLFYR
jgi:hypothetical protein